jgi:predicted NBD/HSP70 family sugar kinase
MQSIRTGSKQLIREINQALVLNTVRSAGAVSRTDIAKRTGLGLPTVSGITAELVEAGLLLERDVVPDGSAPLGSAPLGRRPVLLSLNAAAGYAVGAKITESHVIAVLTDLDAQVVARHDLALRRRDIDSVVDTIAACVAALAPAAGGGPIHGAGIGLAGVIDRDRGQVRHATYSDWESVPLARLAGDQLGMPVVVDNDVNALVAAEQWFGAGRGISDFVAVSVGRGIGLGLVLDGRLYRGSAGGAGELGHVKVAENGPPCPCGARGCLESLASEPAIVARVAAAKDAGRLTISRVLALAADGDADAMAAFESAGRLLGTAIGNLLNLLNPRLVILAGEGTRGGPYLLPALREALEAAAFDGVADELELVIEPWDDEAWARGAASLLLGELFQPALRPDEADRPSLTART